MAYGISEMLSPTFPRFGITALTVAIDKGLHLLRDPARGGVAAVGVSCRLHRHFIYETRSLGAPPGPNF